jgi:hypothetical protein
MTMRHYCEVSRIRICRDERATQGDGSTMIRRRHLLGRRPIPQPMANLYMASRAAYCELP